MTLPGRLAINRSARLVATALAAIVLTGCMASSGDPDQTSYGRPADVPAISKNDRVLWIKLDDTNGAMTDSSGFNHTVQTTAVASVSGVVGNAGEFQTIRVGDQDINSYLSVADAADLGITDNITIEAWIKPTQPNQTSFIVAKNKGWNIEMSYALALRQGAITAVLANSSYQTSYVLPIGQWTHVAVTRGVDDGVIRIYADGIKIFQQSGVDFPLTATDAPLIVGARNSKSGLPSQTKHFSGLIDEVSVHRSVLLPSQICNEAGRDWYTRGCGGGAFGGAAPVAETLSHDVDADQVFENSLSATDADTPTDELLYVLEANGNQGIVKITNPKTGSFTYTPYPLANGKDQFTFYATDGVNRSETAAININIKRANATLDSDGDGVPDYLELAYGFDPNAPGDAAADLDGDGTSNGTEINNGTDPTLIDGDVPNRVLALGFNEGTGATVRDVSSLKHDGTLASPQWILTSRGSALTFDGNDSIFIDDSDALDLTSALTFGAWINPDEEDQLGYVIAKNYGWDTNMAYAIAVNNGRLHAILDGNMLGKNVLVPTSQWSYITVTWDGTDVKFYINGTLQGTDRYTGNVFANTERLIIGGRNRLGTGTTELFSGAINQVQLWNVALDSTQVCAGFGGQLDADTCTTP